MSPPSTVIFLPLTLSNNIIRISAVTLTVAAFCMRERSNIMSDRIFDDLPDILDATRIASVLRISRAGAYNLLSSEDFPRCTSADASWS